MAVLTIMGLWEITDASSRDDRRQHRGASINITISIRVGGRIRIFRALVTNYWRPSDTRMMNNVVLGIGNNLTTPVHITIIIGATARIIVTVANDRNDERIGKAVDRRLNDTMEVNTAFPDGRETVRMKLRIMAAAAVVMSMRMRTWRMTLTGARVVVTTRIEPIYITSTLTAALSTISASAEIGRNDRAIGEMADRVSVREWARRMEATWTTIILWMKATREIAMKREQFRAAARAMRVTNHSHWFVNEQFIDGDSVIDDVRRRMRETPNAEMKITTDCTIAMRAAAALIMTAMTYGMRPRDARGDCGELNDLSTGGLKIDQASRKADLGQRLSTGPQPTVGNCYCNCEMRATQPTPSDASEAPVALLRRTASAEDRG